MSFSAALDAVVGVAHSALDALATLLTPVAGGLAAALAIVLFTVAVRLLISPLGWLQARSARRAAALAPRLAALRERHRDDPVLLATETLALQRANGAGPFAALLPALAQAPFFMLMYRLVRPGPGAPAGVLGGHLFGVPLTAHLAAGLPVFAGLLALATGLAWWSARRARRLMATPADPAQPGAALLARIVTAVPYLTVLMVAWLPLAGGLYLVTSAAWTALEQVVWRRPAPTGNR
ncbi:membrane protein insertase YidC [Amorphoplanes nipponensis]|uniref:Membrane protein insertase YidC n=1 Tax=Actinoplanes nipponensis TaxID=135950 RepID=A0A919JQB1_9ACTN|nr:membrane protein insertase YidC [Actinoplanes nipponensis]GIE53457.1 protein translocase component YidC [Actinoplanes nipponensis]